MLKVKVMRLNKNGIMQSYTIKLKDTKDKFSSFAEAPFKAEVVVYQTAEDLLE